VNAVPGYDYFYNDNAVQLVIWSIAEAKRKRANKLYRAACRMEYRYREARARGGTMNPYRKPVSLTRCRMEVKLKEDIAKM